VLAATFGILASLPLVFLVELGFTVALGVLIDTIIIRSVLVTAINLDLGAKIWWPGKIDSGQGQVTTQDDLASRHRADVPVDA
jgi:RND superfamily putative drug exporter